MIAICIPKFIWVLVYLFWYFQFCRSFTVSGYVERGRKIERKCRQTDCSFNSFFFYLEKFIPKCCLREWRIITLISHYFRWQLFCSLPHMDRLPWHSFIAWFEIDIVLRFTEFALLAICPLISVLPCYINGSLLRLKSGKSCGNYKSDFIESLPLIRETSFVSRLIRCAHAIL